MTVHYWQTTLQEEAEDTFKFRSSKNLFPGKEQPVISCKPDLFREGVPEA